jgi:hypothetical protein
VLSTQKLRGILLAQPNCDVKLVAAQYRHNTNQPEKSAVILPPVGGSTHFF